MVIRGKSRGNGAQLANYLMKEAGNDNVCVFDIRGTSQPENIKASLLEMSLTAELTRSDKGLYHAQINPAPGEDKKMSSENWFKAADILEEQLGLKGQKRVMVLHEKKDRQHIHVVWERYDHEKGKMISDSFSRLAQDRARHAIEAVLEHNKTPLRNPYRPTMKIILSELWQKTTSGKDFIKESLLNGYTIAKGHFKRPYMVVDEMGRSFDLTRQINGVRTKEVNDRLHKEKLPTEKEVIEAIRSDQNHSTHQQRSDSEVMKPGFWIEQYEKKQTEMLRAHHEQIKEQQVKELMEQLVSQRNFQQGL